MSMNNHVHRIIIDIRLIGPPIPSTVMNLSKYIPTCMYYIYHRACVAEQGRRPRYSE
jgi:hypothetical protein